MQRFLVLLAFCLLIGSLPARSQGVGTFNEVAVPTASDTLDLAPGQQFDGKQVFVRNGQQGISFDFGRTVSAVRARVDGGALIEIYTGSATRFVTWSSLPPSLQGLGSKPVQITADGSYVFSIEVVVIPPAQRAFVSTETNTPLPPNGTLGTLKHTILVWSGTDGGATLDKPLLVVEGIDASNENSPGAYYALGASSEAPLFPRGQAEGADIAILDFGDGGRRMQANAAVVRRAIEAMRQYKTNPQRSLDVIGVSMGGVVARYALAQMEQERALYGVGTFMSVDAPQQGAVIDPQLQLTIRQYLDPSEWPAGLARPAGRQLLQYNAFYITAPTDHRQFYDELRALNGGRGYPTLTTNVGVSFGSSSANPGQRWGRLDLDHPLSIVTNGGWNFDVGNIGGPTAEPGSYLPRNATRVMGNLWLTIPRTNVPGFYPVSYVFGRYEPVHPTFIPYASALDITNGVSKFDGPPIALPASTIPSFHDEVPEALVVQMLNRLGYELPAPTSVTITGPSTLPVGQTGTWRASVPNASAGYQYNWDYRILFPRSTCGGGGGGPIVSMGMPAPMTSGQALPPPGGGGDDPEIISCGVWHARSGSGGVFTYSASSSVWLEMRVRASSGGSSRMSAVKRVCIGSCTAGRPGPDGSGGLTVDGDTAAKGSTAQADASVDLVTAIDGVRPNPVGVGSRASVAFTVAEPGPVAVRVFDVLGREVARLVDAPVEAGAHVAWFDASSLPAGAYVVRLETGSAVATRLVTITR